MNNIVGRQGFRILAGRKPVRRAAGEFGYTGVTRNTWASVTREHKPPLPRDHMGLRRHVGKRGYPSGGKGGSPSGASGFRVGRERGEAETSRGAGERMGGRVAWARGSVPTDVKCAVGRLPTCDSAVAFSNRVQAALSSIGFDLETEWRVPDRGDGRFGKIDVVATRGDEVIAIELDRKSARKKSVYKLLNGIPHATVRVVFCRE